MRCRFLYNPQSGRGKIQRHIDYITMRLKEKYTIVDVYPTKSRKDLLNGATDACGKFDALIFAGGDGTVNDVVTAISPCPNRPILGYIPSGTICDVAKNLGIPRKLRKSIDIILAGKRIKHDVGMCNETYFVYIARFGDFTSVAYNTKHHKKKFWGRLAYYFAAIRELKNHHSYNLRLELEDEIIETTTPLFLVLNTKSVAGFSFNKKGHRNDGTFDIYIVKGKMLTGLRNLIALIIFGHLNIRKERISQYFRASKMKVITDGTTAWSNDGEKGITGSASIINLSQHIEIFVGK